jgi:hypothetical protein
MDEIRLPVGATELLAYFEGISRDNPDPHWHNGAEMCRRWMSLTSRPSTQAEIDEFVARLETEPTPGSAWIDLGLQFRHWARSQGFRV